MAETPNTITHREHGQNELQEQEQFNRSLMAAPVCISILGQLNLIACKVDFPLHRKDKEGGFVYLKYPESFRASLTQVSNLGELAFLKAQSSMDAIAVKTKLVPSYINEVHEILTEGEDDDLADVPIALKAIERIVNDCKATTKEVVDEFQLVMLTLNELQQASQSRRGEVEKKIGDLDGDVQSKEMEEQNRKTIQQRYEKECKELQGRFEEENAMYKEAMTDLTSAKSLWTQIGLGAADVITNQVLPMVGAAGSAALMGSSLTNLESLGVTALGAYMMKQKAGKGEDASQNQEKEHQEVKSEDFELQDVVLPKLKTQLNEMKSCFEMHDGKRILKPLITKEDFEQKIENFEELKDDLNAAEEDGANKKMTKAMRNVCNKAVKLCQKMSKGKEDGEKLSSTLQELITDVNAINIHKYEKPKSAQNSRFGNMFSSKNYVENYARNMHTKVELTKEALGTTREQLEKSKERELENTKKMHDLLRDLSTLKLEKCTQAKILEVLQQGLLAFAQLKEQWTKLLQFFEKISLMVEASMREPMINFHEKATRHHATLEDGGTLTKRQKRNLSIPAIEALKGAFQVHCTAVVYREISKKYFQPMLSQLGVYMALDAEKDAKKIQDHQKKLKKEAESAQLFVEKQIKAFHEAMDEKLENVASEQMKALAYNKS